MTKSLTIADLLQFTGSESWYRHGLVRTVLFTDGARHVADAGGAYWLLDEIAFVQRGCAAVAAEPFQCWTLRVAPDRTGTLRCEDGNGGPVFRTALAYTDFPLAEITLWAVENEFGAGHVTIMLPSEY